MEVGDHRTGAATSDEGRPNSDWWPADLWEGTTRSPAARGESRRGSPGGTAPPGGSRPWTQGNRRTGLSPRRRSKLLGWVAGYLLGRGRGTSRPRPAGSREAVPRKRRPRGVIRFLEALSLSHIYIYQPFLPSTVTTRTHLCIRTI
ncbi:hornerin-like [Iris pallida]|uniref:Hornerin-like n=1 Tax=Iris pallida TaxID=29817 RepID=A0AAX6E8G0_IRIPA|nr:hornerin-like [Iris pallida]